MNEDDKLFILAYGGLFGLMVIALIGTLGQWGIIPVTLTTTGFNILTLQDASFLDDSGPFPGQQQWLLTLVSGGPNGYVWGDVSPSQVEEETGKEPVEPLKVEVTTSQWCQYPLKTDTYAEPVYYYDVQKFSCLGWAGTQYQDYRDHCPAGEMVRYGPISDLYTKCWCVSRISKSAAVGQVQVFYEASVPTTAEIKVTKGDKVVTTQLSSADITNEGGRQIMGYAGSDVYAIWSGNLINPGAVPCPTPDADIIPIYHDGEWKLHSKNRYTAYLLAVSDMNPHNSYEWVTWDEITNTVSNANNAEYILLNSEVSFGTINEPTSLTGAVLRKQLDSLIQNPLISLYVKASWLKYHIPHPDLQVVETSSSGCFKDSGGQMYLKIKNTGETGGYTAEAVCGGLAASKTIVSGSIDSGSEKTVVLDLVQTQAVDKTTSTTCKITLRWPLDNVLVVDQEICLDPFVVCTPNKAWCENNKVMQCDSTGTRETVLTLCGAKTCTYTDSGEPYCKQGSSQECAWYDVICHSKNLLNDWEWPSFEEGLIGGLIGAVLLAGILFMVAGPPGAIVGLLVGGVGGYALTTLLAMLRIYVAILATILSMNFAWDFLSEKIQDKQTKLIVAIVLALIAGYVTYISYWYGVILLAIYAIAKMAWGMMPQDKLLDLLR